MSPQLVEFLPSNHAVQRLGEPIRAALIHAQQSVITQAFPNAGAFCARVLSDLKLSISVPAGLTKRPVTDISDLPFAELEQFWRDQLVASGMPESAVPLHTINLAQRSQLVRAYDDPDGMLEWVTEKVTAIIAGFPKTAADIELGRNPGDVLDAYILAATQILLYEGDLRRAIGATVAHKALMILEGLMGHLHEELVGRMRGNVKTAEPRGENQELFDPNLNPFPGADIVQPPATEGMPLRLHQVKSKTGTLNSSGGARLAEQMRQLRMRYRDAEIYSHSLVGNTLRGHRSMGGMLRVEPNLIVTVGENAFRILTASNVGAELLLRLYQNAFRQAAAETGYNIDAMAVGITDTFRERAEAEGEGFLELLLHNVTRGEPVVQDSRTYRPAAGPRRSRSA